MLRLGAAQVKQVAHHAPNGIPSRPPAMAGRDVATPIYDVPRVYAAERGFAGISLHLHRVMPHRVMPHAFLMRSQSATGAVPGRRFAFLRFSLFPSHTPLLASHHLSFPRGVRRADRVVSCADPQRGGRRSAARRHTGSSITLARRDAALATRSHPVAIGTTPLGAPPWRFPAAGPRFNSGSVHRIHVATCPPARSQDLADWVPYLPRRGSLPVGHGTPRPAPSVGSSPETPLMSENESCVA